MTNFIIIILSYLLWGWKIGIVAIVLLFIKFIVKEIIYTDDFEIHFHSKYFRFDQTFKKNKSKQTEPKQGGV